MLTSVGSCDDDMEGVGGGQLWPEAVTAKTILIAQPRKPQQSHRGIRMPLIAVVLCIISDVLRGFLYRTPPSES